MSIFKTSQQNAEAILENRDGYSGGMGGSPKKKNLRNIFISVFVVILALSWGLSGIFTNRGDAFVVSGKLNITTVDFYSFYRSRVSSITNINSFSQESKRDLVYRILREFIFLKILELEVESLGMDISDEDVADMIRKDQAFYNVRGQFDKNLFKSFLMKNSISEEDFLKKYKMNILVNQLLFTIVYGICPSDQIVKVMKDGLSRSRVCLYKIIKLNDVKIDDVTESELLLHYEQNKHNFVSPEGRSIRFFVVDAKLLNSKNLTKEQFLSKYKDSVSDISEIESDLNIKSETIDFISRSGKDIFGGDIKNVNNVILTAIVSRIFDDSYDIVFVSYQDGMIVVQVDKFHQENIMDYDKCEKFVKDSFVKSKKFASVLKAANEITSLNCGDKSVIQKVYHSPFVEVMSDDFDKLIQTECFQTPLMKVKVVAMNDCAVVIQPVRSEEFALSERVLGDCLDMASSYIKQYAIEVFLENLSQKYGITDMNVHINQRVVDRIIRE
ncbi:peptidylprolyl isomerase [Candidatus Gromoviella agglomerans]|uniref:peptidylprolyl isomerase n=1 Tax=Candidatus Gromoviella agglomerans TaxID=2806609 RepID=UPI001E5A7907|nr:peptidylprolyl isomerase [Candidatus Gromoviella agglomerans]UFX98379.1 Peptidyl-prolyl cis-trans isomerase D [Candidatus Gromoviella agglomerans]